MVLTAEVRRERRRAKAAPFPRPRGGSPSGCTWDEQQGGWWRADGSAWGAAKDIPKGPRRRKDEGGRRETAFEEELAARRAREEAVRFDGCTVYCAKHLYTLHRIPDPLSVPTNRARRITCKSKQQNIVTSSHSGRG